MPLKSNAATDELSSPFYKKNEALCHEWEEYILKRDGQINGVFNAWSYDIKAKVKGKQTWLIDVKKGTYTNGHLFYLFMKKSHIQRTLIFRALFPDTGCDDFRIKRSRYHSKLKDHAFSLAVLELVKQGMVHQSLYEVTFKKNELRVVYHDRNDWFEIADRVLEFDFK